MLILSRRTQQQVVFPQLGINVRILQVRGRIIKLGIDAPDSIKVLRGEIAEDEHDEADLDSLDELTTQSEHRRRNELNVLQLRLETIQRRIDRGEHVDAEETLRKLLEVGAVDHQFDPISESALPILEGRPIRLLVVEDCDNERRLMAYVLASHGFDVHVARDGAEAFSQLRLWGTMPDFVLMDMQMPLSGGLETLHRIRQDERLADLKVFAVTGTKRVLEDEPAGRGWDGWFSKPLDVQRLIACLRQDEISANCSVVS